MGEFREWLAEQIGEQDFGAERDPRRVRDEALTDALGEYDRHHPPRRATPMTVDEVSDWVMTTSDWEPDWCNIQQENIADGGHIDVFADEGYMATVSQGGVSHHHRGSLTARLLPILDRICRETGWGGQ